MLKNMSLSLFFQTHVLVCLIFLNLKCYHVQSRTSDQIQSSVHIGVVVDLSSPVGSMADLCMRMALSDFYSAHPDYKTRLELHVKNADTVIDANLAVLDLLKNEDVHGILGPQRETEDSFIAELGGKVHVPIISFIARSSTPHHASNYSITLTLDDAVQAQALAAICLGFEWHEVVVLYEDTNCGYQFLSHLSKAFRKVDVGLAYTIAVPTLVEDIYLLEELENIRRNKARITLVHMNPALGYRLFTLAKSAGIVSEGFAWITSDSLSNFMNSMDSHTRDSMQGVLGIRPYIYHSRELKNFQERWQRNMLMEKTAGSIVELNVYGLWAYDAVTSLAIAVEKSGPVNSTSFYPKPAKNGTDSTNLRISTYGPGLLHELSRTKFKGLAGDFQLVDGKLKQPAIEIFNVYGSGEKTIGFWTPERGITRELNSVGEQTHPSSTKALKNVIWPGDSITQPNFRAISTTGYLRVGVPFRHGFPEFCSWITDPATNHTYAAGFAVDIFLATLKMLPFHSNYEIQDVYKVMPSDPNYDDMLRNISQNFDMIVGDTTIWAPRSAYIDFSLPYSESGVILVVKNKKPLNMWIFVKPFKWDLWLTILVACILMGLVMRLLERPIIRNGEDSNYGQKERPGMVYLSPLSALAFPERNMVSNTWSLFVLMFWIFMAFILMQSYTANLSAILTVDQLKFAFSDNYYVGYQMGSFTRKFLIDQLHINPSRLRPYWSIEEFHNAMSLGSKNGGIDAVFDEIPYMKLFLTKYDTQYKMVGPTYRTGGFGFVFPRRSPLVAHFSRAILNVTQGPDMTAIEQKNFGPGYSSQDPLSSTISQGTSSLTLHDFAGLFLIIGSVTIFSLFCSKTTIGQKLVQNIERFTHFFTGNVRCFLLMIFFCFRTSAENSSTDSVQGGGEDESVHRIVSDPLPRDSMDAHDIQESHESSEDENHIIGLSDEASTPQDLEERIDSNRGIKVSLEPKQENY